MRKDTKHSGYLLVLVGSFLIMTTTCKKSDDKDLSVIKDGDGNIYTSVTIGTQVWLVENLKTTSYNDGTPIPHITYDDAWEYLPAPAFCWYHNSSERYKNTYGALYNWYTVNSDNICPKGWHVPTDEEWTTLIDFHGGESIAGGRLKESGTTHWLSPNEGATNQSGFSALPGGSRNMEGLFENIGRGGGWWSTAEFGDNGAWSRYMIFNNSNAYRYGYNKKQGLSIRCIKD